MGNGSWVMGVEVRGLPTMTHYPSCPEAAPFGGWGAFFQKNLKSFENRKADFIPLPQKSKPRRFRTISLSPLFDVSLVRTEDVREP